MNKPSNRLIHEQSPYLLQHAHNPVDWRPWGREAFAEARDLDKPLFLSVGYATCHWCHVMERESFEDPDTAALINEHFIPVKVDREERPDIDAVYMSVCQTMTGSGGWPLTVFLTPERDPFFSATYIPKDSSFGRMGLKELITKVGNLWTSRREDVLASAQSILDRVQTMQRIESGAPVSPGKDHLDMAVATLAKRFDSTFGGFGTAPKFPSPHNLLFLLQYTKTFGDGQARHMALKTLRAMRRGGIFDHVGFGFHRYSTDRVWLLPHFEKMLYDQAMLLSAYAEAYAVSGDPLHRQVCIEVFSYLSRDLLGEEKAFHCAEDADSEGEEGLFYLFRLDEVQKVLGPRADLATSLYGLRKRGNYRDEATGETNGLNILHLPESLEEAALGHDMELAELLREIDVMRTELFRAREKRVRPLLDDKILTDWNGLAIAALARTGRILGDAGFLDAARKAAAFFLDTMLVSEPEGPRLLHRYRKGNADIPGFLDDYAFLTWGLLELHKAKVKGPWLATARELVDTLEKHFSSPSGLFHLSPGDGDPLPIRPLESYDAAIPSGNSVTLHNLFTLARITGEGKYTARAKAMLAAVGPTLARNPAGFTFVLYALTRNMAH